MINIENVDVYGWEAAIRGMRNPMNSWEKSDSEFGVDCHYKVYNDIGENDLKLMKTLSKAGNDHAKYLRMINVTLDITAPLYFWKEFDTYKVGTVRNSCSTMHKIHVDKFKPESFSNDAVYQVGGTIKTLYEGYIDALDYLREMYNLTREKKYWKAIIQMLPDGYNMKATVQLNYQVLQNIYSSRLNHKLSEWKILCKYIETLPYFEEICIQKG